MDLEKYKNLKLCLANAQLALMEISDDEILDMQDKILTMISLNLTSYSVLIDTIIEQKEKENERN